jgi:8-oxo-dGTP diphosphatase
MRNFQQDKYLPHLSIDCVIFGYQKKELKVLISKLKFGKGAWSLPGGYVMRTEGIDKAASRILKERTNLKNIYLDQFRVFGDENRIVNHKFKKIIKQELKKQGKPFNSGAIEWMTSRFVCIGYYALVNINKVNPQIGEFDEYLEWRNVHDVPPKMTYDHNEIITFALEALRQNLDQKLIGFNLLPETFTMKEVQELYEAVYERPFAINNFQKKILDLHVLERLEKKFTGAQNKAPYLYRFSRK